MERFSIGHGSDRSRRSRATSEYTRDSTMEFVTAYLKAIDLIAILAAVILVFVAFYRKENFWFGLLAVAVVIWAAQRIFGLF